MKLTALVALLASATLLAAPSASAKEFKPGDLRLCNPTRCIPIKDRAVLRSLSAFYYAGRAKLVVRSPRLGARMYELQFRNRYVTGIVAGVQLDSLLSYGVCIECFRRGEWYRFPNAVSAELRRLATGLAPQRLTRAAIAKSR